VESGSRRILKTLPQAR